MILKTACPKFKKTVCRLLVCLLPLLVAVPSAVMAFPVLSNGVIYLDAQTPVPVDAVVMDFYKTNSGILFAAKNEREIVAGAYIPHDKKTIQYAIASYHAGTVIARIAFDASTVYVGIHEEARQSLYRVDVNTGVIQSADGITDFILLATGLVILKNDNTIAYDTFSLPLLFSKKPRIVGHIEHRIVIISDEDATELVDIAAMKPVYRYSNNVQYVKSHDYNLEIQISDIHTLGDHGRVFYKIYANRQESGRTEPVLSINVSSIVLNLPPGQYHEVVIERWRLNESERRYVRDNNIRQPKPLIIYMYPERILVYTMRYNGLEYVVSSGFKTIP